MSVIHNNWTEVQYIEVAALARTDGWYSTYLNEKKKRKENSNGYATYDERSKKKCS